MRDRFGADVTWLPYDLHPEYPPEGIPRAELNARYGDAFHGRLRAQFEAQGLAYNPPPDVVPNTRDALRLTELARERGLGEQMHDRLMGEAVAHDQLGDGAASDRALARLRELGEDAMHYQIAQVHAMRGEVDQAFSSLELAWKFRDTGLMLIRGDPFFDRIRQDSRMAAIERRLRLPSS